MVGVKGCGEEEEVVVGQSFVEEALLDGGTKNRVGEREEVFCRAFPQRYGGVVGERREKTLKRR